MTEKRLQSTLSIPTSGIVFASGLSLIGTAVAGPVGGVTGAVLGVVGGIFTEVASLKRHEHTNAPGFLIKKEPKVAESKGE